MGNNGGSCGNVNVKSTNECCATSTKDTKGLQLVVYLTFYASIVNSH